MSETARMASRKRCGSVRSGRAGVFAAVLLALAVTGGCQDSSEVKTRPPPENALLLAVNGIGDLVGVERANGVAWPALDTFVAPAADLGMVGAAAFDPLTGRFFAATGGTSACPGCIYEVNLDTGEATLLADNSGIGTDAAGMAVRPDGVPFAYYMPGDTLTTVDTASGIATSVGTVAPPGTGGNGIAFDLAGTLYHGDDGNLNVLNDSNGAVLSSTPFNLIGFPTLNGITKLISLATHPLENRLYGILDDSPGGGGPRYLVTVDPGNGNVVNCGETLPDLDGLVFLPPDPRYVPVRPDTPRDVMAFGHNGAVTITWKMSCVPEYFNLFYGTGPNVTPENGIPVTGLLSTTFVHGPLSNGTTYYYVMTTVNAVGPGSPSPVIAGTPTNQITLISYGPPFAGPFANPVTLSDEQVAGPFDIGFDFTFFGRSYSQFYVSSNGFITFRAGSPAGCCAGGNLPAGDGIDDLIALAWSDLNPGGTGVSYQNFGISPYRQLVLEFANVPMVGGGTVTVQAVLFETSNLVEIHTTKIDRGHIVTQGLEDASATRFRADPRHVASDFALSNDAIRFRTNQ